MERKLLLFALSLTTWTTFAQGLVNFQNTSQTLVSANGQPITGPPGSYYFALLFSGPNPPFPPVLSFSGLYATNVTTRGLFSGGASVVVPGWPANGFAEVYEIVGWSANLGHDFDPAWLNGVFPLGVENALFGVSGEGISMSGASTPGDLFAPGNGFDTLQVGFNLFPVGVPEPSTVEFVAFGAAAMALLARPKKPNGNKQCY